MTSERLLFRPCFKEITREDIQRVRSADIPKINGVDFVESDYLTAESPTPTQTLDAAIRKASNRLEDLVSSNWGSFYSANSRWTANNLRLVSSSRKGERGVRDLQLAYHENGTLKTTPLFQLLADGFHIFDRVDPDLTGDWYDKLKTLLKDCIDEAGYGDKRVVCSEHIRRRLHLGFRLKHESYCNRDGAWFAFSPPDGCDLNSFRVAFEKSASQFIRCFEKHNWYDIQLKRVETDDLRTVTTKIVDELCSCADKYIGHVEEAGYKQSIRANAASLGRVAEQLREHEETLKSALEEVQKRSAMITQVSDNMNSVATSPATAKLFA